MVGRSGSILGISPGTRTLGIAVVTNGDLEDWGVKTFSGTFSKMKLRVIRAAVEQLIERYGIAHIAIKHTDLARTSKGIEEVTSLVVLLAEKKNIAVTCYSLDQLKTFYVPGNKITKPDLMGAIKQKHPELSAEYHKERQIANRYYMKLFEAVAVADMRLKDQK